MQFATTSQRHAVVFAKDNWSYSSLISKYRLENTYRRVCLFDEKRGERQRVAGWNLLVKILLKKFYQITSDIHYLEVYIRRKIF